MIKIVNITPYPRQMFLVKDEAIEGIYKRFSRTDNRTYNLEDINGRCGAVFNQIIDNNTNKLGFLVYFPRTDVPDKTLVHEMIHVLLDTFEEIDEQISYDCQEPIAYLAEYIFNELQIFIKE